MKSRAHFQSHPIHPILVAFPIAFFFGAFIFDIISFINSSQSLFQAATYILIAGIIGGLMAAIPGLIDLLGTVPPKSSAKKRGVKHGIINTTVVVLFAVSLWLHRDSDSVTWAILVVELVACILLTISGYMGGTLVYRNLIGVDMRYANAGKWKELFVQEGKGKIEVADEDELKENQMKLIHANGQRIVLARTDKGYVAFDDHCTHRGGSLAGGAMICGTVQCPWHGSHFDVKTGAVKAGPAKESIKTHNVTVEQKKVFLEL
jgi:uncharacterized membrane protein/nitrite reductase/ring-hydroxylating ferredoxin subunit